MRIAVRSVVILFLIAAGALFLSCNKEPAKKKLVVYSPHGKEMLTEFEKMFEASNPDTDVQWLDMGSQEVYDRIRTEKANPLADVWWGAPATIFMRAEKEGLLEQYTPSWAQNVPAQSKSSSGLWFGTFVTPQVIAFNEKSLIKETAPKDWSDIVSPEWKGKIVIRIPMASGTMRAIFSAMIAESVKRTGSDAGGFDWLRKLNENTSAYAADPTQMYIKLAGNDAVTLWNMPDIFLQKEKYQYPFGFNFPSSGTVVLTDAIGLIKGSKNPEAAKKFYEFVTTESSLILQAEKFYRIPARTDIQGNKLPAWISGNPFITLDLDWGLIAEKESEWMKKWDSEIKK